MAKAYIKAYISGKHRHGYLENQERLRGRGREQDREDSWRDVTVLFLDSGDGHINVCFFFFFSFLNCMCVV